MSSCEPSETGPADGAYPPPDGPSAAAQLAGFGRLTEVALWGGAVLSGLAALVALAARRTHVRLGSGDANLGEATRSSDRHGHVAGFWILLALGLGCIFIVWLWRLGATLRREGRSGTWAPGWAIGSWFIPVANLVLPFLYVNELWRLSAPGGPRPGTDARLWLWWLALCSGLLLLFAGLGQTDDLTSERDVAFVREYGLTAAAWTAYVVAGVLGALVVRAVTRRVVAVVDAAPAR